MYIHVKTCERRWGGNTARLSAHCLGRWDDLTSAEIFCHVARVVRHVTVPCIVGSEYDCYCTNEQWHVQAVAAFTADVLASSSALSFRSATFRCSGILGLIRPLLEGQTLDLVQGNK